MTSPLPPHPCSIRVSSVAPAFLLPSYRGISGGPSPVVVGRPFQAVLSAQKGPPTPNPNRDKALGYRLHSGRQCVVKVELPTASQRTVSVNPAAGHDSL